MAHSGLVGFCPQQPVPYERLTCDEHFELGWAAWMPAHDAVRVLVDGAFTRSFDETTGLLFAFGWLAGLAALAVGVFHRLATART